MILEYQLKGILFSFIYGLLFFVLFYFNKKYLLNKTKYIQFISNLFFMIDNILIYYILLRKINNNILHYYFLLFFILGVFFSKYYFLNTLHKIKSKIDSLILKWYS